MPLDPSILLSGQNFNDQFQKDQAAQAQAQATQNQLQLQKYSVAQAKSDFEDQQNLKQAWRQANGDPTQTMAIASQLGVSPKTLQAYQLQQLNLQDKIATMNKTVADTGKTQLETQIDKGDVIAGKLTRLADPNLKTPDFMAMKPGVISSLQGIGSADDIQRVMNAQSPQEISDIITAHQSLKAQAAAQTAQAATSRAAAENKQAQTAQDKLNIEKPGLQATSTQAVMNGTATHLGGVLKSFVDPQTNTIAAPGLVAYDKELQNITDPDVKKSFPTPQALSQMPADKAMAAINEAGQSSDQRQKSAEAAATLQQQQQHQTMEERQRQQQIGIDSSRAASEATIAQNGSADREINQFAKPYQTSLTLGQGQLERIAEARQMLQSGNAEGIALAIPKVLSAIVGGQGSGVRITQPELQSIASARGVTGDVQALFQKATTGQKLTPTQTSQLQGILDDVSGMLQKKTNIANDTINNIQNAPDRATRIKADQDGRSKLNALENPVKIPTGARMGTVDGKRVFSTDGGKTAYDAQTGQKVQ